MSNQVTGRVFIKINGVRQRSKEGARLTYTLGAESIGTREAVVSDRAVEGYKESVAVPQIDATFVHAADVSLASLHQITDATITFECDTGRSFLLRNAWSSKVLELAGGDVSVLFQGISVEEV